MLLFQDHSHASGVQTCARQNITAHAASAKVVFINFPGLKNALAWRNIQSFEHDVRGGSHTTTRTRRVY